MNDPQWLKNAAPVMFALIVAAAFFFCIYHMLSNTFPAENKDALNSLLGVLTTIFTLQMNFFFGSSAASKAKDDTLNEIAKSAPIPSAPPPIPAPPAQPIIIPNADSVKVETKEGDVNVNSEGKTQ
jgi:hypothetical protein